jgi:hypothetical protein
MEINTDNTFLTAEGEVDLRGIYSSLSNALAESEVISCDAERVPWDLSMELLASLLDRNSANSASADFNRLSFNLTVQRSLYLLERNMHIVLVDKGFEGRREEGSVHRAFLAAATALQFISNISSTRGYEFQQMYKQYINATEERMKATQIDANAPPAESSDSSGSAKKALSATTNTVTEDWGPVLIVCKLRDLDAFEAALTTLFHPLDTALLTYYGSDSDRISLRSYLRSLSSTGGLHSIGTGLYTQRSHAHVILTNYETLLLDLHFFKDFQWSMAIFDSPWGFFFNPTYAHPVQQCMHIIRARHRLFLCNSLTGSDSAVGPEETRFASFLAPFLLGLVCQLKEGVVSLPPDPTHPDSMFLAQGSELLELDSKAKAALVQLMLPLTVVCTQRGHIFPAGTTTVTGSNWERNHLLGLLVDLHDLLATAEWMNMDLKLASTSTNSKSGAATGYEVLLSEHDSDGYEHLSSILKEYKYSIHLIPRVSTSTGVDAGMFVFILSAKYKCTNSI